MMNNLISSLVAVAYGKAGMVSISMSSNESRAAAMSRGMAATVAHHSLI
jgi:hypothetical protein